MPPDWLRDEVDYDLDVLAASELKTFHRSEPKTRVDYVYHKVVPEDTLMGLSIKYGVAVEHVTRANKLWSQDNLISRKLLFIPRKNCAAKLIDDAASTAAESEDFTSGPDPRNRHRASSEKGPAATSALSFLAAIDSRTQQAKTTIDEITRSASVGSRPSKRP
eukprot:Opistho-2@9921